MKRVIVTNDGRYTHHGIGYTEHDGFGGTADNRWPLKMAIAYEVGRNILPGEQYQLEVNGVVKGIFVKEMTK
jgi:hypothetical protein